MDIEHPDITRINRFGYHDPEAFDYELRLMTEEYTEDEEIWPDGVTHSEWQDMKKGVGQSGKVERTAYSSI